MIKYSVTNNLNLVVGDELLVNLNQVNFIRYESNEQRIRINTGVENHYIFHVTQEDFKKFLYEIN